MLGNISTFEAGETPHPDVIKVREQKRVDEMSPIDTEFWVIDCFFRNLQPRGARTEETAAPSPIECHFRFPGSSDQIRQIEPKQIMTFDHIRIALLDYRGKPLECFAFRLLGIGGINQDQFIPPPR